MSNKIQAGLELIAAIKADQLSPQELIDILHSLITKDWTIIHRILAVAVEKKLIKRIDGGSAILPEVDGFEERKPTVKVVKERGTCSLCGKQISVCHYVDVGHRTYGPFGSTCVRKVRLMG